MREKDDSARGNILEAAKAEFLERGFAEASMRTIAERAGFTTGMLYSRFADKSEIFRELVEGPADELYNYFMTVQNEFAGYSPEYQRREMHPYVAQKIDRMVDLIYDNFDAFKLILCKSGGTSYEYYVDKMIDVETESTFHFIDAVKGAGYEIADIRKDLAHMLASAMFNGMFEVVRHRMKKADADKYIRLLNRYHMQGFTTIFNPEQEVPGSTSGF